MSKLSNQKARQEKEMKNLFQDPKFARNAFRSVGGAVAMRPAAKPVVRYDKDGNETFESQIETYTYNQLYQDLQKIYGPGHEPTELEMIMACQAQMARINASNFVAFRDSIGAKPVDESKIDNTTVNEFSQMTDEELELLAKHRAEKEALVNSNNKGD